MWHTTQYLGSEIYHTGHSIWQEIKNIKLVPSLGRFYSIQGINRISQTIIPVFKIVELFSVDRLQWWLAAERGQRDLYHSTLLIPSTLKLIEKRSVSRILVFFESIFKTAHV